PARALVWRGSRATSQAQPGEPAPRRLAVPGPDDLVGDRCGLEGCLRVGGDERPAPEPAAVDLLGEDRPAPVGELQRLGTLRGDRVGPRAAVKDHAVPRALDDGL